MLHRCGRRAARADIEEPYGAGHELAGVTGLAGLKS
jgi:hypothetical protein